MGTHQWETYANNPFTKTKDSITLYLADNASLSASSSKGFRSFTSDPDFPVPFIQEDDFYRMAPKHYMNDDQRFVTKRPDVLSFVSPVLTDTIDVSGIIKALIDFSTDHGDADIYVKIIDILPMDRERLETDAPGLKMNGYQKLVRLGYIRGRYREGFDTPKPFKKNKKTTVDVPLLEVRHTFLPGHRIMIQIQSSMFPLFDINPQNYVENIFEAELEDFEPALHKVFGTSRVVLPVMK
jgi:predicted acyl esterase